MYACVCVYIIQVCIPLLYGLIPPTHPPPPQIKPTPTPHYTTITSNPIHNSNYTTTPLHFLLIITPLTPSIGTTQPPLHRLHNIVSIYIAPITPPPITPSPITPSPPSPSSLRHSRLRRSVVRAGQAATHYSGVH